MYLPILTSHVILKNVIMNGKRRSCVLRKPRNDMSEGPTELLAERWLNKSLAMWQFLNINKNSHR